MPRFALLVPALLLAGCVQNNARGGPGRLPPPDITQSQPQSIGAQGVPQLPGFSAAVKIGNTVYLSGQVPLDSNGVLVGKGDLAAQAAQTFANLARVVRTARGVPPDLVKVTVYVVGYDTSAAGIVRKALEPYTEPGVPPALTMVGVASLPEAGMLIAADGVAVLRGLLPDKMRDRGR
ncbi:MAG: RidA family protein [Gemmatimonadales bacterium]